MSSTTKREKEGKNGWVVLQVVFFCVTFFGYFLLSPPSRPDLFLGWQIYVYDQTNEKVFNCSCAPTITNYCSNRIVLLNIIWSVLGKVTQWNFAFRVRNFPLPWKFNFTRNLLRRHQLHNVSFTFLLRYSTETDSIVWIYGLYNVFAIKQNFHFSLLAFATKVKLERIYFITRHFQVSIYTHLTERSHLFLSLWFIIEHDMTWVTLNEQN